MENQFVILHLSDAHLSETDKNLDESIVCKSLLDDIAKMHEEHSLTPNLVVLSGDLIKGCHPPCETRPCVRGDAGPNCKISRQLTNARRFIEAVVQKAGAGVSEKFPLLIVPGNHDINRNRVDMNVPLARKSYKEESVRAIQEDRDTAWPHITRAQQQWYDVVKAIPNLLRWDDTFLVPSGTIRLNGMKIGVVGLNSSWASYDENDKGLLWIGSPQFHRMLGKIKDSDFKIVAIHHPLGWLAGAEELEKQSKFETIYDVHLHGHRHHHWFSDSLGHLRVEGGASYSGSKEKNAYSWIRLYFGATKKEGEIWLRTYSDEGAGGWVPVVIPPDKTDERGRGEIKALFLERSIGKAARLSAEDDGGPMPVDKGAGAFDSIGTLITQLQRRFKVRWVPHLFATNTVGTQIFWPVRLRYPTAIHAAQCFIAAAMQKVGCSVNLYIDNLGKPDHAPNDFLNKFRTWFSVVVGNFDATIVKYYSEIGGDLHTRKREKLETLLLTKIYKADKILEIAKIWHPSGDPQQILNAIRARRPARLLTPAMTWTCLESLYLQNSQNAIITLGGYDEKNLWEAWKLCLDVKDAKVGHLYVSELRGLRMADNPLEWPSTEEILAEFTAAVKSDESGDPLDDHRKMIPWCINNCVLIPQLVVGTDDLKIVGTEIHCVEDLKGLNTEECMDALVTATARWLLR